MNNRRIEKVQEVFLKALQHPKKERRTFVSQQCEGDSAMEEEVCSLLHHNKLGNDLFEKGIHAGYDESIVTETMPISKAVNEEDKEDSRDDRSRVVSKRNFLSKLHELNLLSDEEIQQLSSETSENEGNLNVRKIASQLVSESKITQFQAKAILEGEPELLIDRYLVVDLIDVGGMGMVFKAVHRTMERTVAIKMIGKHLLSSAEQVKRFQREVRVAATLEHPNIVRSYDADQMRGVHFLVMEFVRGTNLSLLVKQQGPFSLERAIDCIRQAANGLMYAQERGITHRDIKPGNLMLEYGGMIKVLDLGLARVDDSMRREQRTQRGGNPPQSLRDINTQSELTEMGTALGTVSFMAPEQSVDARSADSRADIYSLGCTLYYLLTAETPFKGESHFDVFLQHREGKIPSLRSLRPDVPSSVEAVYQRMMAKDPADRFQSMKRLIAAIDECQIPAPVDSEPNDPEDVSSEPVKDFGIQPRQKSIKWLYWTIPIVSVLLAVAMLKFAEPPSEARKKVPSLPQPELTSALLLDYDCGENIYSIAFSPDQTELLAAGMNNGAVGGLFQIKYEPTNRTNSINRISGFPAAISKVKFLKNGNHAVAIGHDGGIYRWQSGAQSVEKMIVLKSGLLCLDILGRQRIAVGSKAGVVSVLDSTTFEILLTFQAENNWLHSLSTSSDGKFIFTGGRDSVLRKWSTSDGSLVCESDRLSGWIHDISHTAQGELALAHHDGTVSLVEPISLESKTAFQLPFSLSQICSYKESGLLVAGRSEYVFARTSKALRAMSLIFGGSPAVTVAKISNDEKFLALASYSGRVQVFDFEKLLSNFQPTLTPH